MPSSGRVSPSPPHLCCTEGRRGYRKPPQRLQLKIKEESLLALAFVYYSGCTFFCGCTKRSITSPRAAKAKQMSWLGYSAVSFPPGCSDILIPAQVKIQVLGPGQKKFATTFGTGNIAVIHPHCCTDRKHA